MVPGLVVLSSTLGILECVLVICTLSSAGSHYGSVELINWAEVYNGKVAAEREWCIRHFDSGSCDVLQLDAFFGATHAAVTYRIESTFAPIQVNNSVTPYSESCLIPNDGALCNGCKDASRAIIAFLIIAIALSILGLYCHCRQVLTSVTRQSKIVLIISGTAMGICGITMLGSFHTNCFKRIPSDFNPRQGSCYVFCSFIFILGWSQAILQYFVVQDDIDVPLTLRRASKNSDGSTDQRAQEENKEDKKSSPWSWPWKFFPRMFSHGVSQMKRSSKIGPQINLVSLEQSQSNYVPGTTESA